MAAPAPGAFVPLRIVQARTSSEPAVKNVTSPKSLICFGDRPRQPRSQAKLDQCGLAQSRHIKFFFNVQNDVRNTHASKLFYKRGGNIVASGIQNAEYRFCGKKV